MKSQARYIFVISIFLSLAFKFFIFIPASDAQIETNNIIQLFNQAAVKHKQDITNLFNKRGVPIIPSLFSQQPSAESLTRVLAATTENHVSEEEAFYPEKTAVLFYSYEKKFLQTWLMNKEGIQAYHRQEIAEQELNDTILQFRSALGVDSLSVASRVFQQRSIRVAERSQNNTASVEQVIPTLTKILIPESIAQKLISTQHLIVVPVLGLGTVPYALLQPFADQSPLIDKMSISIAPSLFDLGIYLKKWSDYSAFYEPLIVGNPALFEDPEWEIPSLPGAEKEVQSVAQMLNTEPLIGQTATKEKVVEKAKTASLLYFATHGVANSDDPLSGGFLMFAADSLKQGWWTAREIQKERFSANLAVLSACQTGLGKAHDAGIIGLARAFQIAGVERVVMSLWSIDDAATNELMQAFMKHLQTTTIPSEALRQAMLETRQKYPHPSHWSSFVLFGTPR